MRKLLKMTVELYLHNYDDSAIDEKKAYRAIESGLDEVVGLLSDVCHAETILGTLNKVGADELPVWVADEFKRLEEEFQQNLADEDNAPKHP